MSDQYPPFQPPSQPPPGYVPPSPPGASSGPAPGYAAPWQVPVHKPGVVALRPLRLGDIFDGAFTAIRRNPRAMVALAAGVTTAFMVLPALLALAWAATGDLRAAQPVQSTGSPDDFASAVSAGVGSGGYFLATAAGGLFGFLATVVLNGMLVKVVSEAVLGRRTTVREAWRAVRGRLPRLLALTLLNLLVSVLLLGVPVGVGVGLGVGVGVGTGVGVGLPLLLAGVVVLVFVQIRYFLLAPAALVLERTGVVASMRRAGVLSRDQFWRLLGILILSSLVVGLVGQVVAVPLGLLGGLAPTVWPGTVGALVAVFAGYLARILVGTLTAPFASGVTALQYVDQRIRKEGLDVQLIAAARRPHETFG